MSYQIQDHQISHWLLLTPSVLVPLYHTSSRHYFRTFRRSGFVTFLLKRIHFLLNLSSLNLYLTFVAELRAGGYSVSCRNIDYSLSLSSTHICPISLLPYCCWNTNVWHACQQNHLFFSTSLRFEYGVR